MRQLVQVVEVKPGNAYHRVLALQHRTNIIGTASQSIRSCEEPFILFPSFSQPS